MMPETPSQSITAKIVSLSNNFFYNCRFSARHLEFSCQLLMTGDVHKFSLDLIYKLQRQFTDSFRA